MPLEFGHFASHNLPNTGRRRWQEYVAPAFRPPSGRLQAGVWPSHPKIMVEPATRAKDRGLLPQIALIDLDAIAPQQLGGRVPWTRCVAEGLSPALRARPVFGVAPDRPPPQGGGYILLPPSAAFCPLPAGEGFLLPRLRLIDRNVQTRGPGREPWVDGDGEQNGWLSPDGAKELTTTGGVRRLPFHAACAMRANRSGRR